MAWQCYNLFIYVFKMLIFKIFFLIIICQKCSSMLDGLYCGLDNCYDLLGVTRDQEKSDITKAYRSLAKKWHPDRQKDVALKEEASEMFQKIANAYEILRDDDTRNDYDYMLDNPEEYYSHYYRYYRHQVAPKVDARIVIVVTISIISIIQYWSAMNNYSLAIDYLATVPKYRIQALEMARREGLFEVKKKKDKTKSKEEIKLEEENILKSIIRDKLDIRGGYSRPSVLDTLWLQIIMSPYNLTLYIYWWISWVIRYNILRHEYTEEDKKYIIRKNMCLSKSKWQALEDSEIDDFMLKELWIKENYKVWKRRKDEEMKEQLADNNRYKQYRRYMKKGGPGQMSFGPD